MNHQKGNKKIIGFFVGGLLLGAIIAIGLLRSQQNKKAVDISAAVGIPFIKVDDKVYTTTNLPGDVAMEYYMLENNIYNAQQNFANELATRIALAKDANKNTKTDSIPKISELLPSPPLSEAEVKQYYDKIMMQMGPGVFGGQSFEKIKPQLEARLNQQKASQILATKVQELQAGGRIQFLMPQPISPPVSLDLSSYPSRGQQDSNLTFVEVADYLCPHCRETETAIQSIYKEYKDKLKFVHVSYPLDPTGLSGALARGAFCAKAQSQDFFWKYHDLAFQVPWEKSQAPAEQDQTHYYNNVVSEVAQKSGLDLKAFQTCLTSQDAANYIKNVQNTFNESKGFQGTPTFYLNNKLLRISPEQLESTLRGALAHLH